MTAVNYNKATPKKIYFGLDLLRVIAVFLVLTIHTTAYCNLISYGEYTPKWIFVLIIHFISLACVPLFLLITGFLNIKKNLDISFYKGIIPLIASYLAVSVLIIIFKMLQGEKLSFLNILYQVLSFKINDYAWYIEMYIGLFLVIPFMNMLWNCLESKEKRIFFIAVLIFITLVPDTAADLHGFSFSSDILPDYWSFTYPITYYFIGAYIYEYKPKLNKILLFISILAVLIVNSALLFAVSLKSGSYAWWFINKNSDLPNALTAVLLFLLLYDLKCSLKTVNFIFRQVSSVSYEIYLFSFIADKLIYGYLNQTSPFMVFAVFLISFSAAKLIRLSIKPIIKLCR